ncbi:hypothetical protein GIB67_012192 [Kingdonia uniflora]|uniref:Uncharacterized protein n=1 Tax=Kingdonia uniflora TaxID=39325 RepID=A0A7J7NP96_9MAGN|nr:hypothetical protein GIB67_012192 [Kingdonia uniflora]
MEASTSDRLAESENIESDRENEVGVVQFLDFPGQLVENKVERRISPEDVLQFYGVKNFSASGGAYFFASSSRPLFFNLNSTCRMWNDNIIWVKGDCLQREDEELMDLLYRTVNKSKYNNSKVKKKKSLLDIVSQGGVELKVVLKELGINRNKRANNRSEKIKKSQATRLMTGVGGNKKRRADGERRVVFPKASAVDFVDISESTTSSKLAQTFPKKKMLKRGSTSRTPGSGEVEGEMKKRRVDPSSGLIGVKIIKNQLGEEDELKATEDRVARLMKGIYLGMVEEKAELDSGKAKFKEVARLKSDLVREGKRLNSMKATQEVEISELTEEAGKNLEEVVVQRDRLRRHLHKMGYSKAEVNDIMGGTYVEEVEDDDDGAEVVRGLDGVSPQTERENQEEENVNPENENERSNSDGVNWLQLVAPLTTYGSTRARMGCVKEINDINFAMRYMVQELNQELADANFIFCDAFEASMEIMKNRQNYGFEVTTDACCGFGPYKGWVMCISPELACRNAPNNLWWDQFRLTDAVNSILADNAWSSLHMKMCYPTNLQDMLKGG